MIKIIVKAMYSAFLSIVLISIILAGWTSYAFFSQPTKSGEIINVIQEMFESQKLVIIDVVDLSKLLLKDNSEIIAVEDNNPLAESESESASDLLTDQEDKSLLDKSSILEDNGTNALGIVIEPSLSEVSEENLPEISAGHLDNDQGDVFINEKGIEMEMS
tara:strand:- start:3041 stop:3523 length:483 start_codon:yes stop_codon:yes gene_type:complete